MTGLVVGPAFPSVCFTVSPARPTGVDHWRALLPARALARAGVRVGVVPVGADLPDLGGDGRWPDVLVVGGATSTRPGATRHLIDRVCRPNRTLYVVDVADDPTPTAALVGRRARTAEGHEVGALVRDQVAAADLVTVPTAALGRVVRRLNPRVEVLPDLAEAALLDAEVGGRPRTTTVGVSGGDSHGRDYAVLGEAWARVAAELPLVAFVVVGAADPRLRRAVPAERFHHVPWQPIDRYAPGLRWIDVACAPLTASRFNRSKSPVKWIEYSLAGAAVVCSRVVYGAVVRDGVTGLVVADEAGPDGWADAIAQLAGDDPLRRRLAAAARSEVLATRCHSAASTAERVACYATHWRRVYGDPPHPGGTRRAGEDHAAAALRRSGADGGGALRRALA